MITEFDSCTWTDPFVQELPPLGKLLFNYSWTNSHKNVACLYTITYKTIKDETGMTQKQIEDTLSILYPKVIYDPAEHLILVVNHVKRTFMKTGKISPKIITAILKNLLAIREGHFLIGVFLNKYKDLTLEYPYPIDSLPIGYQDTLQVICSRFKVQGSELKEGDVRGNKRAVPIPVDFQISDSIREWAKKEGFTRLEERLSHFVDWARSGKDGVKKYVDWDATFRNAIRGDYAHLNNGNGKKEGVSLADQYAPL
jgi:hypothetical protein